MKNIHTREGKYKMKKALLFGLYFGKLPNTFEYWLSTCRTNSEFDFIVFTDDDTEFDLPSNVKIKHTSFENLRSYIQNKFDYKIALYDPYKLCDFRMLYGYIFSKLLDDYKFWGIVDFDMFFGKIANFFTDEMMEKYDKINVLGHLSVFRNIKDINMLPFKYDVQSILTNPTYCGSDEVSRIPNINKWLTDNGYKVWKKFPYLDIDPRYYNFHTLNYSTGRKSHGTKYIPTLIYIKGGKLFQLIEKDDKIFQTELLYVHFQKRKIELVSKEVLKDFALIPNKIIPYGEFSRNDILKYNKIDIGYMIHNTINYYKIRVEKWFK